MRKAKTVSFEAEMLLVAVGRMPYLEGLGLENTKVVVNPRGTIKVNEYCETDEPNVFAIGDVIDTAWLAHLASKEGSGRRKDRRQKGRADQAKPRPELHLLRPRSRQRRLDRSESERSRL